MIMSEKHPPPALKGATANCSHFAVVITPSWAENGPVPFVCRTKTTLKPSQDSPHRERAHLARFLLGDMEKLEMRIIYCSNSLSVPGDQEKSTILSKAI